MSALLWLDVACIIAAIGFVMFVVVFNDWRWRVLWRERHRLDAEHRERLRNLDRSFR